MRFVNEEGGFGRRIHNGLVSEQKELMCNGGGCWAPADPWTACAAAADGTPGGRTVDPAAVERRSPERNVSMHLLSLHRAGVVSRRHYGACVFYTLTNPHVATVLRMAMDAMSGRLRAVAPTPMLEGERGLNIGSALRLGK